MLDCGGVHSLRIRFSGGEQPDLGLGPGRHGFGRSGDVALAPVASDAARLLLCIDRGGIWLQLADDVRGVHVNGRPVRRMAMLRLGDTIYLDGVELVLLSEREAGMRPPAVADATPAAGDDFRMLLRGVGGQHHGRCYSLAAARLVGRGLDCAIRIDEPGFADHHARLELVGDSVVLHGLAAGHTSLVNGEVVRDAVLQAGDQLNFGAGERFVIESPGRAPPQPVVPNPADDATSAPDDEAPAHGLPASARRLPWLLLAALLLAASLSALLLFGAR